MQLRKSQMTTAVLATLFTLGTTYFPQAIAQTQASKPEGQPAEAAKTETAAERIAREKIEAAKKAEAQKVETIIVTASGRSQSASSVPYNVTAISEEALREANITDLKKLITQNVSINAPGNSARFADSVTVRGLNVSPVNANNIEQFVKTTVAYYLDDTPLPNIGYRIKDITRVETLLGPQGTLYGAGSLGGTIRYITNQPQLGKFEGKLNTGFYQTQHGGLSNDTDAMFNFPVGDSVAIRASIARLDEKGYTDRISNPPWRVGTLAYVTKPDANQNIYKRDDYQNVDGGRIAVLWKATPGLSFTLAHAEQKQLAHGTSGADLLPLNIANSTSLAQINASIVDPDSSPCQGSACRFTDGFATPYSVNNHTIVSRYPDFANRNFKLDSLSLDWDLGFANLHSSTSQFKDSRSGEADYASQGYVFYYALGDLGGANDSGRSAFITFDNTFKGLSHETRLTSKGNGPLQWIAGLYYTKQDRNFKYSEILPGMDAYVPLARTQIGGNKDEGYRENLGSQYKETAVYGEAGYNITPEWLTTVGLRYFKYDDTAIAEIKDYAGGFVDSNVNVNRGQNGKSYFKLNSSYNFTKDLLGYVTFSQGFRRGGTNGFKNQGAKIVADSTQQYEPDSTDNYELGLKGSMLNRALYLQADYFRINWKNVQTYFSQDVNGFPVNGTTNGPSARTQGFETQARYRFSDSWQVTYAGAYTTAEWNETKTVCLYADNTTNGCRTWTKGGQLGGTPKWKHNFGGRYSLFLDNGASAYASVNGRYVGGVPKDRSDDPTLIVTERPAYTIIDANVGGSMGPWEIGLYVQNLANKQVEISGQAIGIQGTRLIYNQPRTVGLNVSYAF